MALLGNRIIIKKDGVAIAGTRSQGIKTKADKHEISSPKTGKWRSFLAGRKEWSVSVSYLVLNAKSIKDVLECGKEYELVITDIHDGTSLTGKAILETCEQSYAIGKLVQGTFQFVGNGELK